MNGKITLSADQQRQFEMAIKRGILKELHRDGMLTDAQFSLLLSNTQEQSTCILDDNTCAYRKTVV